MVKLLGELKRRTSDLKPTMQVIGELVKTSVKRNFEVGGRYSVEGSWQGGSKTWLPLSAATLFSGKRGKYITKKGKYRKGVEEKLKNRKTLIDKGRLMKSINWRATNKQVSIGTNVVYAAIHNFGGPAGRGRKVKIPARPFLVIQGEDLRRITGVIEKHIIQGTV